MTVYKGKQLEILAPAGNNDSLRAAVINGADAVYLGASAFSARAKANNFTPEQLESAIDYCHLFGVKVYLAVNTLIKPNEYQAAIMTVKTTKELGIDAIIVQDLPFLDVLHSTIPDIIVHLSTQAGIHNIYGAKIAKKLGAKRVILARETLLEDIRQIRNETDLEIEYFVHGALCVAFSGNCYFSSLAAGLSGNRGKCLQLCRKEYASQGKCGYFLSAKDLNMSDELDKLIEAGVTSFKIEGRMRRPEYVGESVKHYKALLSGISESSEKLDRLFNRGNSCKAYFTDPTNNVIYPNAQGHIGVKIGSVTDINTRAKVLNTTARLHSGDCLKFFRNRKEVGNACCSDNGSAVHYSGAPKEGDEARITTDSRLIDEINKRERKIPLQIKLTGEAGTPLFIQIKCDKLVKNITSKFTLQSATSAPINSDTLIDCFGKTGNTEFTVENYQCNIGKNIFVPKSQLNEFRRSVFDEIKTTILEKYKTQANIDITEYRLGKGYCFDKLLNDLSLKIPPNELNERIIIQTDDLTILDDFTKAFDAAAYFPKHFDFSVVEIIKRFKQRHKKPVYLNIPNIIRGQDAECIVNLLSYDIISDIIANNIGVLSLANDKNVLFGPLMNIINPDFNVRKVLSPEYDGRNYGNNFVYAFGKFPLMTFAHCPKKTLNNGNCILCNQEDIVLTDELKNNFTVRFYKEHYCYSQILNCVPIDNVKQLKNTQARLFIDLLGYNSIDARNILQNYICGMPLTKTSTRGYFNKSLS